MLSAINTSAAPPSALGSNKAEGRAPNSGRSKCGTISPTKPTTPVTATLAPTVSPVPSTTSACTRPSRIPRERAVSSPRLSASSDGPVAANTTAPSRRNGSATRTSSIPRSVNAPISQSITSATAYGFGAIEMTKAVSAPDRLASTVPAKMNWTALACRQVSAASSAIDPPAAAIAQTNTTNGLLAIPSTIAVTAPSAALDDTPTTPGSASGLRKYPCSTAPDRPSTAPIARPSTARGKRSSNRIAALVSWPNQPLGGIHSLPAISDSAKEAATSPTSSAIFPLMTGRAEAAPTA